MYIYIYIYYSYIHHSLLKCSCIGVNSFYPSNPQAKSLSLISATRSLTLPHRIFTVHNWHMKRTQGTHNSDILSMTWSVFGSFFWGWEFWPRRYLPKLSAGFDFQGTLGWLEQSMQLQSATPTVGRSRCDETWAPGVPMLCAKSVFPKVCHRWPKVI